MRPARGLLKITRGLYRPGDSVCCPARTETTWRRWERSRYVVVRRRVVVNHY